MFAGLLGGFIVAAQSPLAGFEDGVRRGLGLLVEHFGYHDRVGRASSDQGGVFTSPWSQTRGLSVGAFLGAIGTMGRPRVGEGGCLSTGWPVG